MFTWQTLLQLYSSLIQLNYMAGHADQLQVDTLFSMLRSKKQLITTIANNHMHCEIVKSVVYTDLSKVKREFFKIITIKQEQLTHVKRTYYCITF